MNVKNKAHLEPIQTTAEILDIPIEVVKDVHSHQYDYLARFFTYPHKPAIFLPNLGRFYTTKISVRRAIINWVRHLRRFSSNLNTSMRGYGVKTSEVPKLVSHWWKHRFKVDDYFDRYMRNPNKATFSLKHVKENIENNNGL